MADNRRKKTAPEQTHAFDSLVAKPAVVVPPKAASPKKLSLSTGRSNPSTTNHQLNSKKRKEMEIDPHSISRFSTPFPEDENSKKRPKPAEVIAIDDEDDVQRPSDISLAATSQQDLSFDEPGETDDQSIIWQSSSSQDISLMRVAATKASREDPEKEIERLLSALAPKEVPNSGKVSEDKKDVLSSWFRSSASSLQQSSSPSGAVIQLSTEEQVSKLSVNNQGLLSKFANKVKQRRAKTGGLETNVPSLNDTSILDDEDDLMFADFDVDLIAQQYAKQKGPTQATALVPQVPSALTPSRMPPKAAQASKSLLPPVLVSSRAVPQLSHRSNSQFQSPRPQAPSPAPRPTSSQAKLPSTHKSQHIPSGQAETSPPAQQLRTSLPTPVESQSSAPLHHNLLTQSIDDIMKELENDPSMLDDDIVFRPFTLTGNAYSEPQPSTPPLTPLTPVILVNSTPQPVFVRKYRQFIVLDVVTKRNKSMVTEKRMRVFDESIESEEHVTLLEDWCDTPVRAGDCINIAGKPESTSAKEYVVNNQKNVIILHPDRLISGTTQASGTEDANALLGTIIHRVFQACVAEGDFSQNSLRVHAAEAIREFNIPLYAAKQTDESVSKAVESQLPIVEKWAKSYLHKAPRPDSTPIELHSETFRISISKALEIEEHIWSLMYGLKGSIDVSVEAVVEADKQRRNLELPLELKSGRRSVSHAAQVIIYSLLMADRYDRDIKAGLLFSIREEQMTGVTIDRRQVVHILSQRNKLAKFMVKDELPPMIRNYHKCSRCFQISNCAIWHRTLEHGTRESSGLKDKWDELTSHTTDAHAEFTSKYLGLIRLEAEEVHRTRKEIWYTEPETRKAMGRCLMDLMIDDKAESGSKYVYRFIPAENKPLGMFDTQIHQGDYVLLSTDMHFGVASGMVTELTPVSISIQTDKHLVAPPPSDDTSPSSQQFRGLRNGIATSPIKPIHRMRSADIEDFPWPFNGKTSDSYPMPRADVKTLKWRIDKDEMMSGFSAIRSNVINLNSKAPRASRLRELIVEMQPPLFTSDPTSFGAPTPPSSQTVAQYQLNEDQMKAAQKVLHAQDYALILGMPGTGKSTTIAYIIHRLVMSGKSVLVTAYTHSAVDNLLMKLREFNTMFLRLGSKQQVHPSLHDRMLDEVQTSQSIAALEGYIGKDSKVMQVVGATCLATQHPLLQNRTFDYCIVDEASQLTLPVCIGPLMYSKVFVLVGDLYQLPPLVKNTEARGRGLADSLFKRLSEAHPSAMQKLQFQYRMNREIMTLSNHLVYSHRLRCGSDQIATGALYIPAIENLPQLQVQRKPDWLRDLLKPQMKVVFVNTDMVPAMEERSNEEAQSDIIRNSTEARLVVQTLEALLLCGISTAQLGVISPWRAQLKTIHFHLSQRHIQGVEVLTVDKYQGRDKDCIIMSLVRSNPSKNVGALLRDWRRVNVAFTRAKKKLVIFGSRSTMEGNHLLKEFLAIIEANHWRYDLPPDACNAYDFSAAFKATQTSPRKSGQM